MHLSDICWRQGAGGVPVCVKRAALDFGGGLDYIETMQPGDGGLQSP